MEAFSYRNGVLHIEDANLQNMAEEFGTPCYVYSRAAITQAYRAYADALGTHPGNICYAVKANSNLAVLNVLVQLGAGFDIVSVGELERVIKAGGDPSRTVFSGVGKTAEEMARALEVGVACFNVESEAELYVLDRVAAERDCTAKISIRINPDVDAKTHPYISTGLKENKFGIDIAEAPRIYHQAQSLKHIQVVGVDCHIGSQLTELKPFMDALERVLMLVDTLESEGITISHLDLGGGLGVTYSEETPPPAGDYIQAVKKRLGQRNLALIFEPGRSIVANAGVLLTRVLYLKPTAHKNFAIIDGAMNDNIRPALYQGWQAVQAVQPRDEATQTWDLVGPVCETADFLAKERELALREGDILALMSSGAYGFAMSSNYNSRPRACELMVDGDQVYTIRSRESITELMAGETLLPQ